MRSSVLLIVAVALVVPLASATAQTSGAAGEAGAQTESAALVESAAGAVEESAPGAVGEEGPVEAQPTAPESAADGQGVDAASPSEEPGAEPDSAQVSDELPDAEVAEAETGLEEAAEAAQPPPAPRQLGAIGYDSQGRQGRIHIVVSGDTLWDISDAYLGTPWVWPSIWKDNREDVENPHRIYPDDRIWITPTEMRRLTAQEADAILAGQPAMPEPPPAAPPEPVEILPELPVAPVEPPQYRVSSRESVGLISEAELESAASIVRALPNRVMLAQLDRVYIGLGEGQVEAGDQFTIFRTEEKVFDPDSGRLLGYHVDNLGWLEVAEVHDETAVAEIRQSSGDIAVGDRLVPREVLPLDVPTQESPEGVEGKISFFPKSRVLMGQIDYVYLNRGSLDGLEVGSPLEVYRLGSLATERARAERVNVPDRVVAEMLVIRAEEESCVALVTHTETELELGDRFRGATR